jgi:acyl dehydratase
VSFVNAFNAVTTVLFDATVTDGSFTASIGLFTTTVAVAVSQFAGLTFNLLMDWLRVGDAVRTTWCIGCNGYDAVGINAQWSVNGVTLVLAVVAAMLLNVSFVNAFNAVTTVLFEATVTDGSFTASIGLFTTTVAVSQLMGWHQLRSS